MVKDAKIILKKVLEKIEPPKEDIDYIQKYLKNFLKDLKYKIKKHKIKVEVFVGGSFAKKTLIKKDNYDVDVFLRFDKKYDDKISEITKDLLKSVEDVTIIHGSRDYFRIKANPHFSLELIPVIKVKNPKESKNITDLSYSHVKYINTKIKDKKILDEIKILKAFCYANGCYGAESYVMGFSGYAIELLIINFKSFTKFLKEVVKLKEKLVIDIEKDYKNRAEILMDLNSSKLHSPIILIDPTFKQRNAVAALSEETFEKFKIAARNFLKNPSIQDFEISEIDLGKIKKDAEKKKTEFVRIEIETDKQEGDIAGSKLLKFSKQLDGEIKKLFEIKNSGFNYNGEKKAELFFVVKPKKEIIRGGPKKEDVENVKKFKAEHKNTFEKKGRIFSKEKVDKNLKKYLEDWKDKNKKKIREMYVEKLEIKKD